MENSGSPDLPTSPQEVDTLRPEFELFNLDAEPGWQKLPGKFAYEGPYLQIEECEYLTPGRKDTPVPWTIAHRKSAIAVAPITEDGRLIMIRQERLPVQKSLWEFPAGQIDENETQESILRTIHQELEEEAGAKLAPNASILPQGWFFASQGFTTERVYLFVAKPVILHHAPKPVGGEHIAEVKLVTPEELKQMIADHEIQDALTLALYARMSAKGII